MKVVTLYGEKEATRSERCAETDSIIHMPVTLEMFQLSYIVVMVASTPASREAVKGIRSRDG